MNGISNAACSAAMKVPGGERPPELCAGMALRGHEHTFSHVERGDYEDMSAAAIWSSLARFEAGRATIGKRNGVQAARPAQRR